MYCSNLAVECFFVTLINCGFRAQLALPRLFLHIFSHSCIPLLLKLLLVQVVIIVSSTAFPTREHRVSINHASWHRGTHGTAIVATSMMSLLSPRLCVQR